MVRRYGILLVLLVVGLSLTGFSSPLSAAAEEEGNPGWLWIVVFLALVAFLAFVLWWWLRAGGEEEGEEELALPAEAERSAATPVAKMQEIDLEGMASAAPHASPEPDDLKRVEGIGPKISGVLQAASITTFVALAVADVERLKEILGAADPNLLRLADPSTWPEQAKLAAGGEWEALEELQGELKGGRHV